MQPDKNFKVRCEVSEAIRLAGQATIDLINYTYACYCEAYKKESEKSNSVIWLQHSALNAVYMLGFLSGSRALRERKKGTQIANTYKEEKLSLESHKADEYLNKDFKSLPLSVSFKGVSQSEIPKVTPFTNITMMSDYMWQKMVLEDRLEHPEKYEATEDVPVVIERLKKWISDYEAKHPEEFTA